MWYLDSGCSNHMTSNSNIYSNLDSSLKSKVKLGNGELVDVTRKGMISVQTKKGPKFIPEVLLVPSLHQNLLSISQMMEKGYILHFEGGFCTTMIKMIKLWL